MLGARTPSWARTASRNALPHGHRYASVYPKLSHDRQACASQHLQLLSFPLQRCARYLTGRRGPQPSLPPSGWWTWMRCRLLCNQRASSTLPHRLWTCTAYRRPRWCLSTTCTAAREAPSSSPELQWTVCRKLFRTTRCAPSRIPQPWRCSCRISATSATCRCAEKSLRRRQRFRLTLPRVASCRAGQPLLLG